jgi:prepilin-type N-terminal cleavage/methylation domain-containing protein
MKISNSWQFILRSLIVRSTRSKIDSPLSGFTLLEMLVTLVIIGVVTAIAGPAFLGFVNRQRLNTAQGTIYTALRNAQSQAKLTKLSFQVAFRTSTAGISQWAVSSRVNTANDTAADWNGLPWQNLDPSLQYSSTFSLLTTIPDPDVHRVIFDRNGNVVGNLGRVILTNKLAGGSKACVIVSTLIGGVRSEKDSDCPP